MAAACARLQLPEPQEATVKFFDGGEHEGLAVRPPGFVYPVLVQPGGGVKLDTYNGRWGDDAFLGRLKQAYAVEAAKLQAKQRGHRCTETPLPGGGIKLTVTAGAAGFGAAPQYLRGPRRKRGSPDAAEDRDHRHPRGRGKTRVETKGFAGSELRGGQCRAVRAPPSARKTAETADAGVPRGTGRRSPKPSEQRA